MGNRKPTNTGLQNQEKAPSNKNKDGEKVLEPGKVLLANVTGNVKMEEVKEMAADRLK